MAAAKGYEEIMLMLLKYQANLNTRDENGPTSSCNPQRTPDSLNIGFQWDSYSADHDGETALHIAGAGDLSCVHLLLAKANMDAADKMGKTLQDTSSFHPVPTVPTGYL